MTRLTAALCLLLTAGSVANEPLRPIPERSIPAVRVADEVTRAKAVITDRGGNPVNPKSYKPGGAAYFSAKMSNYGDVFDSIVWDVEPAELAELCEESVQLDRDGGKNPCILIPYGNDFPEFTVRLFVVKDNAGSRAKVAIKVGDGPRPPPKPDPDPTPLSDVEAAAKRAIDSYADGLSRAFQAAADAKHAEAVKANESIAAASKTARQEAFSELDGILDDSIGGDRWDADKAAKLFREIGDAFGKLK